MTRVIHVSKTASGGRFIGFQLRYLNRPGLELHLAVPGEGTLATMARDAGATVHVVPSLHQGIRHASVALRDMVEEVRPDLLHTHFVHSTLAARAARRIASRDVPILFQVPGPLHLEKWWSRSIDIKTAGARDHWGAACQWSMTRYRQSGVPQHRVHLTYYGKDLDDYCPDRSTKSVARTHLGLDNSRFIAVMVSHIYPPRRGMRRGIKGHEDFIRAIALAQRTYPHIQGLIVGGPRPGAQEYLNRLKKLVVSTGADIQFLGPRDDVTSIYAASDLAVHPSLSENLGGAGESLLMEVPTISTTVGGFPDIVRDGISGLTVPPKDPRRLAEAIVSAAEDPARMQLWARAGRGIVKGVGDAESNAHKIADVYKEML